MRTDALDYDLPAELIAQHPAAPRDAARLMVVERANGAIRHAIVRELPALLNAGDALVVNDSRVLPARFFLRRRTGGRVGGLFLRELAPGRWAVLLAGGGRLGERETLAFERGQAEATVVARLGRGEFELGIEPARPAATMLDAIGVAPLPPYIRRSADASRSEGLRDRFDYQTVYAREPGSAAAPTAGLHFTPELLAALGGSGVTVAAVTLHVGLGTFQPIEVEDLADHAMHVERYEVSAATAAAIAAARRGGGRVVAVGTTAARVIESTAGADGVPRAGAGETSILIQPPYRWRGVDCLMTNFHLPRSTLLALVYAFGGMELMRAAYATAIGERYRFYSFGDAMLIV
ncbi:MAG: tRNA preQ1(34) S-adenosylmethionine ribosyltransferase-isomerase QueA [Phycisphaerae bacterium]